MARLKCKKCGNIFERGFSAAILLPHLGPYHYIKCPACGKSSWINVYSSVKDAITWPPQERNLAQPAEARLTEEELEKKRIEDSKYERS
jgi:hypothetical protein